MGATFSAVKTWTAGETLTASDLNAEFNNILNNLDPTGIDDESANDAAAQATSDPYAGSSLQKATSLETEIQQLRYLIAQITGETYWYIDPDTDLAAIHTELTGGLDPADIDDESPDDTAARATKDPYAASSLVKATSLQEEIQELRYLIAQITGETYWYIDPDTDLATLSASTALMAPSTTVMLFGQTAAPTGWTKKTDWQDNAMLCYATGTPGSGGSANPQSTHTHTGPSHTHTGPSHTHTGPSHTHQWYDNIAVAGTNDQTYNSSGSAVELPGPGTAKSGTARSIQYDVSQGATPLADSYVKAAGTGATGADGTGATGADGTGATGANSTPHYQEVIAATKD